MRSAFNGLGKAEHAAVIAYVRSAYDTLVFQQPASYVSRNAQRNPEGWQDRLRELIASGPTRVQPITEAAERNNGAKGGFTLIELSIVLVIIGLIVGGVLAGQHLIRAARVSATVTQIEKFNTAANTFYGKYGYLPGDFKDPDASNFGFAPRGAYEGQGDGNGVMEGNWGNSAPTNCRTCQVSGELVMFWVDLSKANLIDQGFSAASSTALLSSLTGATMNTMLPLAKLNSNSFIYVYSGLANNGPGGSTGVNYFGVSGITSTDVGGNLNSKVTLSVQEANSIDNKTDDGLPQSGNITAQYVNFSGGSNNVFWAGGPIGGPYTTATVGSSSSCFDNGGNAGTQQSYSVEISNGSNITCALSFRMQAGSR